MIQDKGPLLMVIFVAMIAALASGCAPDMEPTLVPQPPNVDGILIKHDDVLCFAESFTVEAWVYADRSPDGREERILSKYGHLNKDDVNIRDDSVRGWEWLIFGEGKLQFRMEHPLPDGRLDAGVNSLKAVPIREWFHLASVYDAPNQEMRLYINGKLDNKRTLSSSIPVQCNPDQDVYFGRYGGSNIFPWSGRIDELRIVADALTFDGVPDKPYEVDEHPKTIVLYHFDEVIEGVVIPNAATKSLPILVPADSGQFLKDSMSGFGRALVIEQN